MSLVASDMDCVLYQVRHEVSSFVGGRREPVPRQTRGFQVCRGVSGSKGEDSRTRVVGRMDVSRRR